MSRTPHPIGPLAAAPATCAPLHRQWINLAAAAAAATVMALTSARAQDPPAAAQASATPSSSSTPAASAPATSTTGTAPAAATSPAAKSDPVCFQLTGRCVDASKAPGAKTGTGSGPAGATAAKSSKKPLNLTAPDVRTVVPEEELKEPLPNAEQITETQESETVSVKGEQGVPPDVPGGLGAIWWAVSHPSQAWRILTPAE